MMLHSADTHATVHVSSFAYNKIIEAKEIFEKYGYGTATIPFALDYLIELYEDYSEKDFNRYKKEKEAKDRQKYWDDDFALLRAEGRIP
jgi:hypothetical protein